MDFYYVSTLTIKNRKVDCVGINESLNFLLDLVSNYDTHTKEKWTKKPIQKGHKGEFMPLRQLYFFF